MKSVPCATDQRTISRARSKTSCSVSRLQLAPDVDALDQRARLVPARLAGRERRVEVEVAVDERRRHEPRFGVDSCAASASSDSPIGVQRPPRPRDRRAGRRADARCARRDPRARVYGARKRATSSALRPYGSRAATRSVAAVPRGRRRPETLTLTGTTPGLRTCERLTLVLPGMFTRRSACDGTLTRPVTTTTPLRSRFGGARRRGAASAGLRRRGSGRPTSRDEERDAAWDSQEDVGKTGAVDIGAGELRHRQRGRQRCGATCQTLLSVDVPTTSAVGVA